jgi:hypothetical protein
MTTRRQRGGEVPVYKLRIKRWRRHIVRMRGEGINVITSWQTRGKQEGTAPQKLADVLRGQEAAAAAQREAL